jgi:asparagine synthase (glutamine-hydrolysing)
MFRFLALAWDASSGPQSQAAQVLSQRLRVPASQWRPALDRGGLKVFCIDARPGSLETHRLGTNYGVVLGSLFLRNADPDDDTPARRPALDQRETAQIIGSRGEWLAANCWGNYVAMWVDPTTHAKWVFKDPTGSLPCFSTLHEGVTVLFSAISDCIDLNLPRFTINHRFVEARLAGGEVTQPRDALNEVAQVRRGECIEIDYRKRASLRTKQFHWTPLKFPRSNEPIASPERAARAMRSTLRSCTRTLAAGHESVLLRLSGGLDSSIVLGCLSGATPRLSSYTSYIADSPSDPRRWARMAAEHAKCEHIEHEIRPQDVDLASISKLAPSAEPFSALMHLTVGGREQQWAAECAATAVFSGDGGDCAFGSYCIGEALSSYLRRNGPRPAAFRLASESALLLGRSSWSMWTGALRALVLPHRNTSASERNAETCRLVARDIVNRAHESETHPWFTRVERVSEAVVGKLGMLLATPDLYAGAASATDNSPEILSPIYAQPVIELCLRIPPDVLFSGGRDRGLARQAFTGDAPDAILRRLWKDRPGDFHEQIIARNLGWLRQILLDGVLVCDGFLDRAAVERALAEGPTKTDVFAGEILRHLDTEMWVRQWTRERTGIRRAA